MIKPFSPGGTDGADQEGVCNPKTRLRRRTRRPWKMRGSLRQRHNVTLQAGGISLILQVHIRLMEIHAQAQQRPARADGRQVAIDIAMA